MTNFMLKLIAIISMSIDHIAWVFFPMDSTVGIIFHFIGRLAMPIFSFLIAEGFRKTSSRYKYVIRLSLFALISQIPYMLTFGSSELNVFFTLLFGLFALMIIDEAKKYSGFWKLGAAFCIAVLGIVASIIHCDHSFWGMLLIVAYGFADANSKKGKRIIVFATLVFSLYEVIDIPLGMFVNFVLKPWEVNYVFYSLKSAFTYEFPAFLSAFLLIFYNGKKGTEKLSPKSGKLVKNCFYVFYPAHLIVLYILAQLLGGN